MTHSFPTLTAQRPDTEGSPSIEARQLVRDFRKGPRAVDGIDLAVCPEEIYGFVGSNAAGKSTLATPRLSLMQRRWRFYMTETSARLRAKGGDPADHSC
jgi:ABC-type multidrug transport system ATPase subunit